VSHTKTKQQHRILRLSASGAKLEEIDDTIAVEAPLHIVMNGIHYVTIMCSPERLEELVTGHLLSEGIVDCFEQIADLRMIDNRCEVTIRSDLDLQARLGLTAHYSRIVTSGCGTTIPPPFAKLLDRLTPLKVDNESMPRPSAIQSAAGELNQRASIYRSTGGVHAACISARGTGIIDLAEDVGRHNAVDKVIGSCARQGYSFEDKFLVSTGRLSGDMVLKAARVKIPVIASISSVLSTGMEIANKTGVTVIGFVRGRRMNIYTHPERIQMPTDGDGK
jgi:FdhD protein